jgi:hypothetical protein
MDSVILPLSGIEDRGMCHNPPLPLNSLNHRKVIAFGNTIRRDTRIDAWSVGQGWLEMTKVSRAFDSQ